jgi:hypothetical protein
MALNQNRKHAPFELLKRLPGEIRNQIFEICIQEAMRSRKARISQRLQQILSPSKTTYLNVAVSPRWHGPGVMRVNGIGPLPLLFVNKQIYQEISSLVFSKLETVSIGGYLIQRPHEDPNIRWAVAYSLLNRQPSLLKFTRKIEIHLPTVSLSIIRLPLLFRALGSLLFVSSLLQQHALRPVGNKIDSTNSLIFYR